MNTPRTDAFVAGGEPLAIQLIEFARELELELETIRAWGLRRHDEMNHQAELAARYRHELRSHNEITQSMRVLGLDADMIFARILEDLERGLVADARKQLDVVDVMLEAKDEN